MVSILSPNHSERTSLAPTAGLSPCAPKRTPPPPIAASIATTDANTVPLSPSRYEFISETQPTPPLSSPIHVIPRGNLTRGGSVEIRSPRQDEVENNEANRNEYEPQKRGEIGWRDSVHGRISDTIIPLTSTPPSLEVATSLTPHATTSSGHIQHFFKQIRERLPPYWRITFFLFLSVAALGGTIAILLLVLPTLDHQDQHNVDDSSSTSQSMMSMSTVGFGYLIFGVVIVCEACVLVTQLRANYVFWRSRCMQAVDVQSIESTHETINIATRWFDRIFCFNRPPRTTRREASPPAYNRISLLPDDSAVLRAQQSGAAPVYGSPEDANSTILLRGPKRIRRGNGSTRSNATSIRRHRSVRDVVELEMVEQGPDTVIVTIPPRAVLEV